LDAASQEEGLSAACGSEFASRLMKSSRLGALESRDEGGHVELEVAFLRYMLSDGAGAAALRRDPPPGRLSWRIEWITLTSYAGVGPPCMYMGSKDNRDSRSWGDYADIASAAADGALALRQDLKLLPRLVQVGVDEYEKLLLEHRFDPDRIRFVAAHYSSEIIKPAVLRELDRRGCEFPDESRWYSNLARVGNVGSAAIFLILQELCSTADFEDGEQVLCFIPESGRFSIAFMLLTAVRA
jgi:3-oxoacyl-[acyl-carrier-protein] synthase-3